MTQESDLGLPHCRQTLYHLNHQGSLKYSFNLKYSFITDETHWEECGLGIWPKSSSWLPPDWLRTWDGHPRKTWAHLYSCCLLWLGSFPVTFWHVWQTHFLPYILSLRFAFSYKSQIICHTHHFCNSPVSLYNSFSITRILFHILSLLECLSDTQTHTPSVLVSAS